MRQTTESKSADLAEEIGQSGSPSPTGESSSQSVQQPTRAELISQIIAILERRGIIPRADAESAPAGEILARCEALQHDLERTAAADAGRIARNGAEAIAKGAEALADIARQISEAEQRKSRRARKRGRAV